MLVTYFLHIASSLFQIPGAIEALEHDPKVCSNYSELYVKKTFPALKNLDGGNAVFTFPNAPIKCAGAPQKICYLADDYLRRVGNGLFIS